MTTLPESRIRANLKYAEKAFRKMTFAFNKFTDADVLQTLDEAPSKRKLIITAIREYNQNHNKNQPQ